MNVSSGGPPAAKRSLRILLAPGAYYPQVGGIEELTRQLALALSAMGHEAAVLTYRSPESLAESELLDDVRVTRLRFPSPAPGVRGLGRFVLEAPPAAKAISRHVAGWRPDVVHVIAGGSHGVYLAVLARRSRTPLIFTTQGELTFAAYGGLDRYRLLLLGLRHLIRNADAVTACSTDVLDHLRVFVAPNGPWLVIPNGVDPQEFEEGEASKAGFEPFVVAVGRLVPEKGFDVLIDALATTELAGLNLVIAGDGHAREELAQRSSEKGVADRVHLVGTVDRARLSVLLRRAESFASASRYEGFGIAVLEAMAAGTPVVVAAAGGVTDFARNGENALVVPPDEPSALAAALARVMTDSSLRARLCAAGERTARDLAWTRIAERYEDVYLQTLGAASA